MAKLALNNLVNLQNEASAVSRINSNNQAVQTAMENTLSRDGEAPNEMLSNLDMNNQRIINLPEALADQEPVRKAEFDEAITNVSTVVEELTALVEEAEALVPRLENIVDNAERDLQDLVELAGQQADKLRSDSSTELTIGVGVHTLTVDENDYFEGQSVIITAANDGIDPNANWMQGRVTNYAEDQLTVNVGETAGSGTYDEWVVTLAGGTGPQGDRGPAGPSVGLDYRWNTDTTGDPGNGYVLVNNATIGSSTAIHISKVDRNSTAVGSFIGTWGDSTSDHKGYLRVQVLESPEIFLEASITAISDEGDYYEITITPLGAAGSPNDDDIMAITFSRTGDRGETGLTGATGATGETGATGLQGEPGLTAYEVAVDAGFVGTVEEWLDSLVGEQGEPGVQGQQGIQGNPGISAYQVAVNAGFVGTIEDWLESLVGPQGPMGDGDVSGPGESVTAGGIVVWDGTGGSDIADSEVTIASLSEDLTQDADEVPYDNETSELEAENVQEAIDELADAVDNIEIDGVAFLDQEQNWTAQQSSEPVELEIDNGEVTWDVSNAQKASLLLDSNVDFLSVLNAVNGTTYLLWVVQDDIGGHEITWEQSGSGSFEFGPDGPPVLSTTANTGDLLCFEARSKGAGVKLYFIGVKAGLPTGSSNVSLSETVAATGATTTASSLSITDADIGAEHPGRLVIVSGAHRKTTGSEGALSVTSMTIGGSAVDGIIQQPRTGSMSNNIANTFIAWKLVPEDTTATIIINASESCNGWAYRVFRLVGASSIPVAGPSIGTGTGPFDVSINTTAGCAVFSNVYNINNFSSSLTSSPAWSHPSAVGGSGLLGRSYGRANFTTASTPFSIETNSTGNHAVALTIRFDLEI